MNWKLLAVTGWLLSVVAVCSWALAEPAPPLTFTMTEPVHVTVLNKRLQTLRVSDGVEIIGMVPSQYSTSKVCEGTVCRDELHLTMVLVCYRYRK